jgi:hypothetical protein
VAQAVAVSPASATSADSAASLIGTFRFGAIA